MTNLRLQKAFVLHSRPYLNTSSLVDLFCEKEGLVRCVAKGQRGNKRASKLDLFSPLQVMFRGRKELKTLSQVELGELYPTLHGQGLFCGFYLNEILMRVLYPGDPHDVLFEHYADTLKELATNQEREMVLRKFEMNLLAETGYLMDFSCDYLSGEEIAGQSNYVLDIEQGFRRVDASEAGSVVVFSGENIRRLANNDLKNKDSLQDAKKITRMMLAPRLGSKPLNSAKLFKNLPLNQK